MNCGGDMPQPPREGRDGSQNACCYRYLCKAESRVLSAVRESLASVAEEIHAKCCPQTWGANEPRPHSTACLAVHKAIGVEPWQ